MKAFNPLQRNLFFLGSCLFSLSITLPIKFNNIAIGVMVVGVLTDIGHISRVNFKVEIRRYFPLVLFYLIYLISFFYSENIGAWKHHAEVKSTFLIFPILFLLSGDRLSKTQFNIVLFCFVTGVLTISVFLITTAAIKYLQTGNDSFFYYHDLTEPLGLHAIYLANYVAIIILLIAYHPSALLRLNSKVVRILMVLFGFLIIFLLSALSVIGFLIVWLIIYAWTSSGRAKNWKTLGAVVIVLFLLGLGLMLVPYTKSKITKLSSFEYKMDDPDSAWNSLTIRMAQWTCAADVTIANPVFGVGAGDEQDALMGSYVVNNFKEGIRCEYNTHNQYLSTFIAVGLPGIFALIYIFWVGITNANENKVWKWFLLLIIVGLVTENMFSLQKGTVMFSFLYSMFANVSRISRK